MINGLGSSVLAVLFLFDPSGMAGPAGGSPAPLDIVRTLELGEAADAAHADQPGEEAGDSAAAPNAESLSLLVNQSLNADSGHPVGLDLVEGDDQGLAIPVTSSISVGVDYSLVEAENLADTIQAAGTMDEDHLSHHVFVRAHWHFGR